MLDSNSFSKAYFRFFAIHVRIINNIQKYIFVFALVKLRGFMTVKLGQERKKDESTNLWKSAMPRLC